jgi:hypothetical protein
MIHLDVYTECIDDCMEFQHGVIIWDDNMSRQHGMLTRGDKMWSVSIFIFLEYSLLTVINKILYRVQSMHTGTPDF